MIDFIKNNQYEEFYNEKSILDIKDVASWKKKNKSYNFKNLPKTAILSLSRYSLKKATRFFSKKIIGLSGQNYILNQHYVFCSEFGNGAPAIVSLMEELRFFGVENFIFIGFGGCLNKNKSGKAFIVSKAFSSSGCSLLYSTKDFFYPKSNNWFDFYDKHLNLKKAIVWSTDAPFRETKTLISYFEGKGAEFVDMEIASIYSFADFYKLNALCILVSADSIENNIWKPPTNKNLSSLVLRKIIKDIVELKQ